MSTDLAKPYVLTVEVQAIIVQSLVEGNYLTVSCIRAGMTARCFDHWRKRWEKGDEVAQQFADFFLACKKACAEAEVHALNVVRGGAPGWQRSAWYLERRYPRRWGRQDRSRMTPPDKPLDQMTDEELERYRERLA